MAEHFLHKTALDAHARRDDRPFGADWYWRPGPWAAPLPAPMQSAENGTWDLGGGVRVFHDATLPDITIGQNRADGSATHALRLGIGAFDGSFLSLAIALPDAVARDLDRYHLLQMRADLHSAQARPLFIRLNLQCGPNCETGVECRPDATGPVTATFDLAHINPHRDPVGAAWIDLILDAPAPGTVTIADLTLARLPRAAF